MSCQWFCLLACAVHPSVVFGRKRPTPTPYYLRRFSWGDWFPPDGIASSRQYNVATTSTFQSSTHSALRRSLAPQPVNPRLKLPWA
ncbi:hypothetical protein B0H11DRAFT_2216195 [Mycena galericulata]|nr:hypothetical protein B0H11DRAFT_2216195 [Mycena galericulata]